MAETAKVKGTGRLGARYGVGIRKRLLKVELEQKKKHSCPKCGYSKVKRLSKGIFLCKKCRNKFAGGAYVPSSSTGKIIEKMVSQRRFAPYLEELSGKPELAKEKIEESKKEEERAKDKGNKKREKVKKAVEKGKKQK